MPVPEQVQEDVIQDLKHSKRFNMRNEVKIGLTVILAFFVGYAGFRFLSDAPMFRQGSEIYAEFPQVDGLTTGGQVYMNGVRIGSVDSIQLLQSRRVRVNMTLQREVQVPDDSRALLTSLGLLDGKAIVIEPGSSGRSLGHGDSLEGVYVDTMMESFGDLGESLGNDIAASVNELNQLLVQLNATLNEGNRHSIGQSLGNLETATRAIAGVLDSRQQELEQSILSASRVVAQLDTLTESSRPRVDSLLTNLEATTGDIQGLSEELNVTVDRLNQILVKIDEGEGTLGQMLNDSSFYHNADSLSIELRELIRGINENPGRYLRHLNLVDLF